MNEKKESETNPGRYVAPNEIDSKKLKEETKEEKLRSKLLEESFPILPGLKKDSKIGEGNFGQNFLISSFQCKFILQALCGKEYGEGMHLL